MSKTDLIKEYSIILFTKSNDKSFFTIKCTEILKI